MTNYDAKLDNLVVEVTNISKDELSETGKCCPELLLIWRPEVDDTELQVTPILIAPLFETDELKSQIRKVVEKAYMKIGEQYEKEGNKFSLVATILITDMYYTIKPISQITSIDDIPRPSMDPEKLECIGVYVSKKDSGYLIMNPYTREGNNIIYGEPIIQDDECGDGRLTKLFPKSTR